MKKPKKKQISPYEKEFNKLDVLLFMEVEPLTGEFEQIMLTKEAFKRVSNALIKEMKPDEEGFIVVTNDDVKIKLDTYKSVYSEKEIKLENDQR